MLFTEKVKNHKISASIEQTEGVRLVECCYQQR